jgi:hypothetical protein
MEMFPRYITELPVCLYIFRIVIKDAAVEYDGCEAMSLAGKHGRAF